MIIWHQEDAPLFLQFTMMTIKHTKRTKKHS